MSAGNTPSPEANALRERISGLSATMLRINANLDLRTVLREIVDTARALTGARYGVITTIGDPSEPQDYVLSGFTDDERRQMDAWMPNALSLFEHLRDLPAPVRMSDVQAYVGSLGLSEGMVPCRTFQATPMRHRGEHVGSLFLGEKGRGEEFTDQDEDVLVQFASQAASAVANARTHRDERRARANLEALIDTCPVGVVVFKAGTGVPLSLNREATRITSGLDTLGRSPVELLEILTARLSDGREVTLDELTCAKTLRGEEIELSVPDGRSMKMLVNATPIRSDTGDINSVVVTMQDLAPFEVFERSRNEFLHMVSHDLRAPLSSIKGSAASALRTRTPDPAELRQFLRIIEDQADRMDDLIGDLLDSRRIDAGTLSVEPRPVELAALVDQARNTFLSGGGQHRVMIDLPPDLPPVLADGRRIVQVLDNLFANAARHSPTSSPIRVGAERNGHHLAVSVVDEGEGVSPELLPRLFRKQAVPAAHGRGGAVGCAGLGLAICKGIVEAHGGRIWAENGGVDEGTRVTFTLPTGEATATEDPCKGAGRRSTSPDGQETPVLVVDDDPKTLHYVRRTLSAAGYAPLVTGDPQQVPDMFRSKRPRLVLLDLMLPGTDGIELMRSVPELGDVPVIFISGYCRDETIARALESGAADYIVKPFSPMELTARVRAALRLRGDPERFVLGDLAIDYHQRRATLAGHPLHLTAIEYDLLRVLSVNAGRVVTYASLLRQAWTNGGRDPASVRGFVKKLRRKLRDDAANPAYIANERGVGYRMLKPGQV